MSSCASLQFRQAILLGGSVRHPTALPVLLARYLPRISVVVKSIAAGYGWSQGSRSPANTQTRVPLKAAPFAYEAKPFTMKVGLLFSPRPCEAAAF